MYMVSISLLAADNVYKMRNSVVHPHALVPLPG